jgi:hypothetical protein
VSLLSDEDVSGFDVTMDDARLVDRLPARLGYQPHPAQGRVLVKIMVYAI